MGAGASGRRSPSGERRRWYVSPVVPSCRARQAIEPAGTVRRPGSPATFRRSCCAPRHIRQRPRSGSIPSCRPSRRTTASHPRRRGRPSSPACRSGCRHRPRPTRRTAWRPVRAAGRCSGAAHRSASRSRTRRDRSECGTRSSSSSPRNPRWCRQYRPSSATRRCGSRWILPWPCLPCRTAPDVPTPRTECPADATDGRRPGLPAQRPRWRPWWKFRRPGARREGTTPAVAPSPWARFRNSQCSQRARGTCVGTFPELPVLTARPTGRPRGRVRHLARALRHDSGCGVGCSWSATKGADDGFARGERAGVMGSRPAEQAGSTTVGRGVQRDQRGRLLTGASWVRPAICPMTTSGCAPNSMRAARASPGRMSSSRSTMPGVTTTSPQSPTGPAGESLRWAADTSS